MNPNEILAMQPGPALDKEVHRQVVRSNGANVPAYSTNDSVALTLLDRVPLFVASIDPGRPEYKEAKPYAAGRLQFERTVQGDVTLMRVIGATKAVVICKAALLIMAKGGAVIPPGTAKGKSKPRPVSLQPQVAQPSAALTKKVPLPPLQPRKPFVAGDAQTKPS